ncbi:MAG: hypothetical protein LBJ96_06100 [Holosporaceae bacterium]|nr:hypothetical protein [Holosporaceae bacterium]
MKKLIFLCGVLIIGCGDVTCMDAEGNNVNRPLNSGERSRALVLIGAAGRVSGTPVPLVKKFGQSLICRFGDNTSGAGLDIVFRVINKVSEEFNGINANDDAAAAKDEMLTMPDFAQPSAPASNPS